METYRLYIDETGDHRYKQLDKLESRYLGLTGLLFNKEYYDSNVPLAVESLKKRFFRYDPDKPPILVRSEIVYRKHGFGVLVNGELNARWQQTVLELYRDLKVEIFTVVIDKKVHIERYPLETFDAYVYTLAVLLWRVRGYLHFHKWQSDIMAEARGKVEDNNIQKAFKYVCENGFTGFGTAEGYRDAFPIAELKFGTKAHNVAGLQLADLVAYGQKIKTLLEKNRPYHKPASPFTIMLNDAIEPKVNRYGRYLLE